MTTMQAGSASDVPAAGTISRLEDEAVERVFPIGALEQLPGGERLFVDVVQRKELSPGSEDSGHRDAGAAQHIVRDVEVTIRLAGTRLTPAQARELAQLLLDAIRPMEA